MKRILYLFFLLSGLNSFAQFPKAELVASGLTCSMCSFSTQKQLMKLPFIDSIGTDLEHTTFLLYFKKDAAIDVDQIKKKVEDAGFSVASLKLTYDFKNHSFQANHHLQFNDFAFHVLQFPSELISGQYQIRVIDKGFVTDKEFKHFQKLLKQKETDSKIEDRSSSRIFHAIVS